VCARAHYAAHYAANREKLAASKAAHYAANRERIAAHYAANREKLNANSAAHYAANREKVLASSAAYQKANPEAYRIYAANRRALKRTTGKLSKGLSAKLFDLQRGKCALPLGDDFHLDHIVPLALGGTNTDDNIQLLRAVCNMQKHAQDPIDFMQQKRAKLL
jgi:5-methylcytosine-specific restriction endonuclease McrA